MIVMRAGRFSPHSPWMHLVLLGPPALVLTIVLMLALHGWMRVPAVLVGLVLLVVTHVWGRGVRRKIFATRRAALRGHLDRMHELAALQETLAHELKNPLAAVKGLAGLIELEPERAGERIRVLQGEVRRMEHILDELLTFSRPLVPLSPAEVDVGRAVRNVTDLAEGRARDRGVQLLLPERAEALCVRADACKLERMLLLLVHHAVEASPPGGAVELTVERAGAGVVVGVHDRGSGAPPPQLPLARALAEQHGGTLTLRARAGGGQEALIALPLRCPECPTLV